MRPSRFIAVLSMVVGVLAGPALGSAQAQDAQTLQQQIDQLRRDFEAVKQQYGDRLAALEARLVATSGTPQTAQAAGAPAQTSTAQGGQQPTATVPTGAQGAGGPSGALPV